MKETAGRAAARRRTWRIRPLVMLAAAAAIAGAAHPADRAGATRDSTRPQPQPSTTRRTLDALASALAPGIEAPGETVYEGEVPVALTPPATRRNAPAGYLVEISAWDRASGDWSGSTTLPIAADANGRASVTLPADSFPSGNGGVTRAR